MLGVDRAEDMLRARGLYKSLPTYKQLPDHQAFYVNQGEQPLVFFKHRDGVLSAEEENETPWKLKLTKFQSVKGSSTLQHSSVSCAQARSKNFSLTGEIMVLSIAT